MSAIGCPREAWVITAPLLAHILAQLAAILRRQVTPAWRAALVATRLLLLPLFPHLLAHLAAFVRRQVAPETLRPAAGGRQQQAEQQDQA